MKKAAQRVVGMSPLIVKKAAHKIGDEYIMIENYIMENPAPKKNNDYTKLSNEMNKSIRKMILGDTYHFKKKLILR